jgi:3-phosphoshikimate 1-carboxyvinyltransferase
VSVPADPSSAAFLAVAACIVSGSEVALTGVSLNPTRIGFVEVLRRMGADMEISDASSSGAEPVGTLTLRYREGLAATVVHAEEVPTLVDEIPILAVAAACASGTTRFEGVAELRVKESDRLEAIARGLGAFGVTVRSGPDWLEVDGGSQLAPVRLDSQHDHRLAMTWAVAALVASGPSVITGWDAIAVSYPRFGEDLERLSAR